MWERRTEWPLVAAPLLFLLGYAIPILSPGISPPGRSVCTVVLVATWAVFVVDLLGRV